MPLFLCRLGFYCLLESLSFQCSGLLHKDQDENEEHFIEALIERNRNGELNTLQEVIQAILDIGGEALEEVGMPITFTARIAHKLLQRSDPLGLLDKMT